ncbi:hypothetical protein C8R44DRAFT_857772 [Mycena epipterygia]|nr:hypothetical protein C8R44DRAFT_857772 [Mycena epipterygia]
MSIHDIQITSFSNPHLDLPRGMQMVAQLIIDDIIVQQTMPVDAENIQGSSSWTMKFDCDIPPHVLTFLVAILRKGPVPRLLGSIEISQGDVRSSREQGKRVSSVNIVKKLSLMSTIALSLPLVKVNLDGPELHMTAVFNSISLGSEPLGVDGNVIPIGSVNNNIISAGLMQMHDDTNSEIRLSSQDLWLMHERILLLPTANSHRGDPSSLQDLGIALGRRFHQLEDVNDITKGVAMLEEAVHLTPEGHPSMPSRLNNLGTLLLLHYQRFGNLARCS